jgi:acetyl esterase/lipase
MDQKTWWEKIRGPMFASADWLAATFGPLALVNLFVPKHGYHERVGLNYGPEERQKLDVYVPKGVVRDGPVVVFFYGGSWQGGRRQDYLFVAEALAAWGCVAVIPDYRVYPEVTFPRFIEDGALAVAWVRDHIGKFGGDRHRLFLMGHSAGAYIAAMLALNPRYLKGVGLSPQDLQGFVGLAGPYDFLPLKSPRLIKIFGGADGIPETQPVTFATAGAPPALLLHGGSDKLVGAHNTKRLARRLREVGGRVEAKIYPGMKHIRLLITLASPFQNGEPVLADIARFFQGGTGASELD